MSEITPLVNHYCQVFKEKEQLRKKSIEINRELKESHEKLRDEMSRADLRIIRSISCGYDIKLYQRIKKPSSSVKNLRTILDKYAMSPDNIDSVMNDIKTGKEETSTHIKLIPLARTKAEPAVVS